MKIKSAWYPRNLPTKALIILEDGTVRAFDSAPFRYLTENDLQQMAIYTPGSAYTPEKTSEPMPDYVLRFYGLERICRVREEYRALWSNDPEWDGMTDTTEIIRLSREWNVSVNDLYKQVEEM